MALCVGARGGQVSFDEISSKKDWSRRATKTRSRLAWTIIRRHVETEEQRDMASVVLSQSGTSISFPQAFASKHCNCGCAALF